MEKPRLPELTSEQTEQLCTAAEDAARKYILSKVPTKGIANMTITVEAEGTQPLNLNVEIDLTLNPETKNASSANLVKEAIQKALVAGENFLGKLK